MPRSVKHHISGKQDLKSLRYLMSQPTASQLRDYRENCAEKRRFARDRALQIHTVMGAGSFIDEAIQMAGVEPLVLAALEDTDYFEEFLSVIWDKNMLSMEIILDEKPDLFIRRGWYENMSFWSPGMFRKYMKPCLEKEIRWAHEAGVKYAYINTCGYMRILDDIIESGVDVLIGVDPFEDKTLDMRVLKKKAQSKMCLWGGDNKQHGAMWTSRPTKIKGVVGRGAPGAPFIFYTIQPSRFTWPLPASNFSQWTAWSVYCVLGSGTDSG